MNNYDYDAMLESFLSGTPNAYNASSNGTDLRTSCAKNERIFFDFEVPKDHVISNKSRKKTKKRRKSKPSRRSSALFIAGLALCLIGANINTVAAAYREVKTDVISFFSDEDTENIDWSIEANPGTLYNIQSEVWEGLSYDERLETIENVKSMELHSLGVPYDVDVVIKNLSEDVLGEYCNLIQTIYIDRDFFNSSDAEEVVEVICHECRHAYQYACIEAYENTDDTYKTLSMFDTSRELLENSNNYYDGDDYDDYASQIMESDAFHYAYSVTQDYYENLIPKYAEKQ